MPLNRFLFKTFCCFLFLIACSVEEPEMDAPMEEVMEAQLPSCVEYQKVDSNDLETYWTLFVQDVICSRGGPDYGETNESVQLYFVVQSPEEVASGVSPDHAGFSVFGGYCDNKSVNIGVVKGYWEDYTSVQQLWLMYHEFGHDVYRYEHSDNRDDIMFPSVPQSNVKINDFIRAKERFFRRDFPGIKYISCP